MPRAQIRFMGERKIYPIANANHVIDIIKDIKVGDKINIKGLGDNLEVHTLYEPISEEWGAYEIILWQEMFSFMGVKY